MSKENQDIPLAMKIDINTVKSPLIRRLIEEVRSDFIEKQSGYNRIYNRHMRSISGQNKEQA